MTSLRGRLHALGAIVALIFGSVAIYRGFGDLSSFAALSSVDWLWFCLGLLVYVISQIIAASAWRLMLSVHGVSLPAGRAESQILLSQIGKYVPGNVAHLYGRFEMVRADGARPSVAGSAMLFETTLTVSVGAALTGILASTAPGFRTAFVEWISTNFGGLSGLVLPIALVMALVGGQVWIWRKAGRPNLPVGRLSVLVILYSAIFALLGVSLWCLTGFVSAPEHLDPWTTTAIFAGAWTVGFLVPGAPGGIGVRDGIIALGVGLFTGSGPALLIAVAHRIVSVLGDVIIFGIGYTLRRVSDPVAT